MIFQSQKKWEVDHKTCSADMMLKILLSDGYKYYHKPSNYNQPCQEFVKVVDIACKFMEKDIKIAPTIKNTMS